MDGPIAEASVRLKADASGLASDVNKEVTEAVKKTEAPAAAAATNAGKTSGRHFGQSFGQTASSIVRSAGTKLVAGFAAFAGARAAVGFIKDSIGEANEAEQSQIRLERAVRNAGGSYKALAPTIDAAIQRQSSLAKIDDEEVADSFTNLVRGTHDVSKALKLNALAADIARARHVPLATAAAQVGKVALGSVGGLRRLGVAFTKTSPESDALKAKLKELGDELKAAPANAKPAIQAQIDIAKSHAAAAKQADTAGNAQRAVDALQKAFAGSAADYAKTQEGQLDDLGVRWKNLQESVGTAIIPLAGVIVGFGIDAVNALSGLGPYIDQGRALWAQYGPAITAVAGSARDLAGVILSDLAGAFTTFIGIVQQSIGFIQEHQTAFIIIGGVIGGVAAGLAVLSAVTAGYNLVMGLARSATIAWTAAQLALDAVLSANPIGIVVIAVAALAGGIVALYTQSATARRVINEALGAIKTAADASLVVITEVIIPALVSAFDTIAPGVASVVTAIAHGFGDAKGFIQEVADVVSGPLADAWALVKPIAAALASLFVGELRTSFTVILGVAKVLADLLRGDFSGAWNDAKATAVAAFDGLKAQVVTIMTQLGPAVLALATAAGGKIADGIKAGATALPGLAGDIAAKVAAALGQVASQAAGYAVGIGQQAVEGIVSGLGSLPGRLASKIGSAFSFAKDHVGSTAAEVGRDWFGIPFAEGLIGAWDDLPRGISTALNSSFGSARANAQQITNRLVAEMHQAGDAVRRALDLGHNIVTGITDPVKNLLPTALTSTLTKAVKDSVTQAKSNAASLAGDLGNSIGQVLDARASAAIAALRGGPVAKELQALQAQLRANDVARQRGSLNQAISAAQGDVTAAQAGKEGAPTLAEAKGKLADAQQALADFELQQRADALSAQLTLEEQNINDRVDAQKQGVTRQVSDLVAAYNEGNLSVAAFNKELAQLLAANDIDYATAGDTLGLSFANAFQGQLVALKAQISNLVGGIMADAGPDVVSPLGALQAEIASRRSDLRQSQSDEAAFRKQAASDKKTTPEEARKIAAYDAAQKRLNEELSNLNANLSALQSAGGTNIQSVTLSGPDAAVVSRILNAAVRGGR